MKEETFKHIWDTLIKPSFEYYETKYGDIICPDYERAEIKDYYEDVIAYAKRHYMSDHEGLLNRHKVSAALMIAILKAKPIKKTSESYYIPKEN